MNLKLHIQKYSGYNLCDYSNDESVLLVLDAWEIHRIRPYHTRKLIQAVKL